jgi:aminoglycoside phosphotransferase (APT) family kinase protein
MDWFGAHLTPLDGGYSGETFLVGDDPTDQVVLRIYQRDPDRAVVDASLLRLVRGILPVPEVVEVRPRDGDAPALLVTERIEGRSLDSILRQDPPGLDWEELGRDIGYILGRLAGMPFLDPGMFDGPGLHVTKGSMPDDLGAWAQHFRVAGRLSGWQQRDFDALLDLVDRAEDISAEATRERQGRVCLVHSDFNPKNVLVDIVGGWVAGLVDWEFSHAGSPYTDYGNLTRFERDERLVGPLIESFVELAPGVRDVDERARAADLWALVELAGGIPVNPVRELAAELLLAQAREGDLHAWPWDTPRVDPKGAKPVR